VRYCSITESAALLDEKEEEEAVEHFVLPQVAQYIHDVGNTLRETAISK